jgi:molecular chaperone GrpE
MVSRKKVKKQEDDTVNQRSAEAVEPDAAEELAEAGELSELEPEDVLETLEAAEPVTEDAPEAEILTPEEIIGALSEALAEFEDRHLRLVAEFDNFRKRTIRERAQDTQRAQAELVKQLLESLDDLARVSEHGSTDHDAAAILEGVQLVERKLLRALEVFGLRRIEAVGQRFDPEVHEALLTVPTEHPEEDDLVSQEMGRGYLFRDSLLRPSLVGVKKYKAPEEGEGADQE